MTRPHDSIRSDGLRVYHYARFSHNAFSATVICFIFTQLKCFPWPRFSLVLFIITKEATRPVHRHNIFFLLCSIVADTYILAVWNEKYSARGRVLVGSYHVTTTCFPS